VPSQVVLSRTLNKKQMLMSVATKIAIQLNCKMGGEVWALEIPVITVEMPVITGNTGDHSPVCLHWDYKTSVEELLLDQWWACLAGPSIRSHVLWLCIWVCYTSSMIYGLMLRPILLNLECLMDIVSTYACMCPGYFCEWGGILVKDWFVCLNYNFCVSYLPHVLFSPSNYVD